MKKSIFMLALASLALVGCSKDEITEVNQGDPIKFAVTSANATRTAPTTTTSINAVGSQFHLWAFTNAEETFMNTEVTKTAGETDETSEWTYSPLKFWPNNATLDFFAVHPTSIVQSMTVTATSQTINEFVVADAVASQIDLLYAANFEVGKQVGTVPINFRHALSQIVFEAKIANSADSRIKVDIQANGISIHNIVNKGTLAYPTLTTGPNMAEDVPNDTEVDKSWGTWTLSEETTDVEPFYTAATTGAVLTTSESTFDGENESLTTDALLLLPQEIEGWVPTEGIDGLVTDNNYFKIMCRIQDVEDAENPVYLWGDNGYEAVYIPVPAITWQQGKKYTYIFNFEDGAGYDENGEPILVPIKVQVTVDEFQSAPNTDVNM